MIFDSPRHRCARHPSLRFAHRGDFYFFFLNPLCGEAEERVAREAWRGESIMRHAIPRQNLVSVISWAIFFEREGDLCNGGGA